MRPDLVCSKSPTWPHHSGAKPSVLVVSPVAEDRAFLLRVLDGLSITTHTASTVEECLDGLLALPLTAVLSEDVLPDGDWRSLLDCLAQSDAAPRLIVASRLADDALWAEVLNLGGFDVLAKPFDTEEVSRVLGSVCGGLHVA
jgi:CheY-like chemotaxis protein